MNTGTTNTETKTIVNTNHPNEPTDEDFRSHPVVFFDGVCGLCNGTVTFLLDRDTDRVLRFAPLQGKTSEELLPAEYRDLNSIALLEGGKIWQRSSAVVRIFWKLNAPWSLLGTLLWCVPLPLRDFGYKVIAKARYRLFGKQETCRMPTPEDQGQMLE